MQTQCSAGQGSNLGRSRVQHNNYSAIMPSTAKNTQLFSYFFKGKVVQKLKRCVRCHASSYCGKECQKKHWKKGGHKQRREEGVLAHPSRYPYMTTISNVLKADKPTVSLSGAKNRGVCCLSVQCPSKQVLCCESTKASHYSRP